MGLFDPGIHGNGLGLLKLWSKKISWALTQLKVIILPVTVQYSTQGDAQFSSVHPSPSSFMRETRLWDTTLQGDNRRRHGVMRKVCLRQATLGNFDRGIDFQHLLRNPKSIIVETRRRIASPHLKPTSSDHRPPPL